MSRVLNVVLIGAMVGGAVLTYDAKHRAETAAARVASLKGEIAREKEALNFLRAEWSVLAQPARLQSLVERYQAYLNLATPDVGQIVTIEEIPIRPVDLPDSGSDPIAGFAGNLNPIR